MGLHGLSQETRRWGLGRHDHERCYRQCLTALPGSFRSHEQSTADHQSSEELVRSYERMDTQHPKGLLNDKGLRSTEYATRIRYSRSCRQMRIPVR